MTREYKTKHSFEPIFDRYYCDLVNFTGFLIKDREAAEMIVFRLYLKIWMLYGERFCQFENVRGYLFKAGYLEGMSFKTNQENTFHMPPNPTELSSCPNTLLTQIIPTLPENLREIARLSLIENLPPIEVANKLCKSLMEIKHLKGQMEDHFAITGHQ